MSPLGANFFKSRSRESSSLDASARLQVRAGGLRWLCCRGVILRRSYLQNINLLLVYLFAYAIFVRHAHCSEFLGVRELLCLENNSLSCFRMCRFGFGLSLG